MSFREVTRLPDRYFGQYVLLAGVTLQEWRTLRDTGQLQEARDVLKGRVDVEILENDYANGADGMVTRIGNKAPVALIDKENWYLDRSYGGRLTVDTASKDIEENDILLDGDHIWWKSVNDRQRDLPSREVTITRDGENKVTDVRIK